ncbi:MAG: ATP-binding cassette domain-containing protein [Thermoanaerobaculia bacterium]|nr:ATP-binding cassette domain-containing protein [Thermoanaerobaculia bacterium]
MPSSEDAALSVDSLVTGYGSRRVLDGVDLAVARGTICGVIGPNGSGKSTLLRTLFGVLPAWAGRVSYSGYPGPIEARALIRHGVVFAPQGNRVFSGLSVLENLQLAAAQLGRARRRECVERALEWNPGLRLKLRQRAGTLSGGEKQDLALACAVSVEPHTLLLDEPSLGLSPRLASESMGRLSALAKGSGVTCLVVEQRVREVLRVADRVCVLREGKVIFFGPPESLNEDAVLREAYLGLDATAQT